MVRISFIISIFFYPAYLSSLKYGCPSPAGGWFSLFLRKLVKIRTMIVTRYGSILKILCTSSNTRKIEIQDVESSKEDGSPDRI